MKQKIIKEDLQSRVSQARNSQGQDQDQRTDLQRMILIKLGMLIEQQTLWITRKMKDDQTEEDLKEMKQMTVSMREEGLKEKELHIKKMILQKKQNLGEENVKEGRSKMSQIMIRKTTTQRMIHSMKMEALALELKRKGSRGGGKEKDKKGQTRDLNLMKSMIMIKKTQMTMTNRLETLKRRKRRRRRYRKS